MFSKFTESLHYVATLIKRVSTYIPSHIKRKTVLKTNVFFGSK